VRGDESGMDNSPRFDGGVDFAAVDFNAFAAAEAGYLAEIAQALDRSDDASRWREERARLAAAIETRLWCEEDGFYYDRAASGEFARVKTVAGFTPLFAGVASEERAKRLVERLTDPAQFWPPFPVPSTALDEPTFTDDMWRGPTWMNYNFLIIHGLRAYGYTDLAAELAERCLDQVATWYAREGTIFEYYDPMGRTSPRRLHRKGRVPTHRSGGIPVITDYNWSAAIFAALATERYGAK
jgi:neutral trehalase